MFLMLKITDFSVYIMDTEDNFSIDEMPKTVFIQSNCLGIPCETRYVDILREFEFSQLRAGFHEYGVESVLRDLCGLYNKAYHEEGIESGSMPLSSLVSVVDNSVKEIRPSVSSSEPIITDDLQSFNYKLDSLRNDEEFYDYNDEEDFDDDIFGGEVNEDDSAIEDYDDDDSDMYDYDDCEEVYEGSERSEDMFCVARLYGILSKSQVSLLKSYYKWYSKRVFAGENGSLHLDTIKNIQYHEWKKKELANIRGDEDWGYEGCIDTGEYPGAYCEMGHPLRYVHYARGSESGKIVSFGNKCVSDFFEVDATVMRAIRKAQTESTSDLVELYRIYSDESILTSAKESFKVLNFTLDKIEEAGNARSSIVKLALEFKKLGLVYPKTLVKELKKSILSVDSLRDLVVTAEARSKLINVCFGDAGTQVDSYLTKGSYLWKAWNQSNLVYASSSFEYQACCFFEWLWGIEFDGIHRYNPVLGLNVRDEGGKSKKAIKLYTNRESKAKVSIFYSEDDPVGGASWGINTVSSLIDAFRLFESFKSNWKLPYLNAYDAKYHNLKLVKECESLSSELLFKILSRASFNAEIWKSKAVRFMEVSRCLSNFKVGFSEVCRSVVLDEPEKNPSGYSDLCNLDFGTLSIDNSISRLQYYIDKVFESPLASFFERKAGFGLDVFTTIKGTRKVSTKQGFVLARLAKDLAETLSMLDSGNYDNAKIEGSLSEEQLRMVSKAIRILEDGKQFNLVVKVIPTNALMKMKDILVSVSNRKIASEKQMYYVNLAKTLVDEADKSSSV